MTKALPFSENAVQKAINGARKAGIKVGAVRIEPDGAIIVLDVSLAPAIAPKPDDKEADNWANA